MKKTKLLFIVLVCIVSVAIVGCERHFVDLTDTDMVSEVVMEDTEANSTEDKIKYIYQTQYVDFSFISAEEKRAWKESLVALLNNEKTMVFDEGGDLVGYSYLYPDKPCIEIGYQLALFDINTDGTPELLVNTGGGSAGNAFYFVYDLITGEELGTLNGGHDNAWCTYFNQATGNYESVGWFEWRSGWMGKIRFVNRATITNTMAWNEKQLYETEWLHAYYQIDAAEVELTEKDENSGYDRAWEEFYPGVKFWVNGNRATIDEYFDAQDFFNENYLRIAQTGIRLISWNDVTEENDDVAIKAEKMAEALVSSEQQFVQPLKNEGK